MRTLAIFLCAVLTIQTRLSAQQVDSLSLYDLNAVSVKKRGIGTTRVAGAENATRINREELFRAACCNLGESFTTNPSVDVNYSDAATGAKQIRLLGLSGRYVQMLAENLPDFRGAAAPYALDYVPGPWLQSIQVSKGAASVKNGYESITGQIDVEYLKPDGDEGLELNLYGNTLSRVETNAVGNLHINQKLSTELLAHWQDDYGHHDINRDGFLDQPNVRQLHLQNRWKLRTDRYIFHGGVSLLDEQRDGGQTSHTVRGSHSNLYKIGIETARYEAYMKHAFILDPDHGTNIALMGTGSLHEVDAAYGNKAYSARERNGYAQLMLESNLTDLHNLSAGLSLNHDYFTRDEKETVGGAYAQYTYNLRNKVVAMAGLRADHSSMHGTFVTPRLHLKLVPNQTLSLRLSAGKGYRTVHALAENHYLLMSGRQLQIEPLHQESAWNYGLSTSVYVPLFGKTLRINAEYYHTRFSHQAIIDYDTDPTLISIANLHGRSYSNTLQVDATYPVVRGLDLTAAWRLNEVMTTYGGRLMRQPLTSRYKGLVSISYKTPLELWQFDLTLQLNGGGRMPTPINNEWSSSFHAYEQLSAQITRWFRHFSVYIGGENLTAVRQRHPIINASDPWSPAFEPTMVWGPTHGAMAYAGVRVNLWNKH